MKTSNKICGIYKITNIINGKFYIGSSNNINRRWNEHLKLLRNFKHQNPHLQNSWNYYDEENIFRLSIIEECLENELLDREQYYIDSSKCYNKKIGYNTCKIAGKGPNTKGIRQYNKMKQVNQYSLNGYFIKSFICAIEAENETGASNKTISRICTRNTYKSAGGYMWTHGNNPPHQILPYKPKPHTVTEKVRKKWVPIFQYDLQGNFIKEYKTIKEASVIYPGANNSAYNYKQRKTAKGYQWRLFKTDKITSTKRYRTFP